MSSGTMVREIVEGKILFIRGHKVMIDRDLAELYGVETKYLNRQVRRNKERFPDEFTFQLTPEEKEGLVTICHRFEPVRNDEAFLIFAARFYGTWSSHAGKCFKKFYCRQNERSYR